MSGFQAKRIRRRFTHRVETPPEAVFPLLCPVREYEWIDGWSCDLIYAESGFAENECVFQREIVGAGDAIYVVSRHDPENLAIEFVITCPGSHVEKMDIRLEATGGGTTLHWTRSYTGLSERGNEFIERFTGEPFAGWMERLSSSLDHFCRTGEKLTRETGSG